MSEAVIKLTIESLRLQTLDLSFEEKAQILNQVAARLSIDSIPAVQDINPQQPDKVKEKPDFSFELGWEAELTDNQLEERALAILKEYGPLPGTKIYQKMNFRNKTKSSSRFRQILKGLVELGLISHNGGSTRSSRYRYVEQSKVEEKPKLQIVS